MKTNFTYSLISVFCFILTATHAQDPYVFRILASKGQNTIKVSSSGGEKPVKTGGKIFKEDEITLAEEGYIGLVHSSGKTIELKTPGVHLVSDLLSKINTSSTSLANKYAEFVFNQMTKAESEDINKNSRVNNKVTGSVERASDPIHLIAPNTTYIHGPIAMINWDAPGNTTEFVVTVKNLFDNNLLTEETNVKNITIDINDPKLKNEKLLIINVKSKLDSKMTSNEVGIKKLPEKELEIIDKDLAALQAETIEETPLNKIIIAAFYEQNHLLLDAIINYEAALKLAPGVQDFKTAYDMFLERNNLKID